MAIVLVATQAGCRIFTEQGEGKTELAPRPIYALASEADGSCLAVVDGKEIWRRNRTGRWSKFATTDVDLLSLLSVKGQIFAGSMSDAVMMRIETNGDVERLVGFDHTSGRHEWFGEGPPLHVRALTATADGKALLAAVHVGGIPRSIDGGKTWEPTIPIKRDVHEVRAHKSRPNIVAAATAFGPCVSEDRGENWALVTSGLSKITDSLAVAGLDDEVLFSIQDGPFAKRSQIWRWKIGSEQVEQVRDGLPEWLNGKVDTSHIAAGNGKAAVVDGSGDLWISENGSMGWNRIATSLLQAFSILVI